ncbi:MAG: hypothetical protein DCC55_02710 [Chloroflexi bacterium]|nr:MAG: hypothetical protein DCC55_02710 [Chloroflexota bacterium]
MNLADTWHEMRIRLAALRQRGPEAATKPMDYRDRISVVSWLLVFGLGLSLLYSLPTRVLTFNALGSPISIPLTETSVAAVFLAVLAAVGANSIVSLHPYYLAHAHRRNWNWSFWALPMALTLISTFVLPLTPPGPIQVLALLLSGALLALAYFCLYATVERGQAGFRRARFVLDALAYGSALVLFLFVYQTRTRSLFSGTLVAMTAILLAVEILRTTVGRSRLVLHYSAIIGLILGQVTWALNYWLLPGLTGGLLLLLIFYLLVGIAQQGLQDRLNRRVLLEFTIFAIVALILIGLVGPGFG